MREESPESGGAGRPALYIGLLHHPVLSKEGKVITTAVTNLDLHDLARLARTYDLRAAYFIQPLPLQRKLVQRLLDYWLGGGGAVYNSTRREAFTRTRLAESFQQAVTEIQKESDAEVKVVGTTARRFAGAVDYAWLRREMRGGGAWFICFGTGWGLDPAFMKKEMHYVLKPIAAGSDYNHLSVRAAAAIILDRLLGEEA